MKKIISIILVLSLVLSLSACGSAETETTVPTVTPTVAPTVAPTTSPTVAPTVTPDVEEEAETSTWISLPSGAVSGSGSSGIEYLDWDGTSALSGDGLYTYTGDGTLTASPDFAGTLVFDKNVELRDATLDMPLAHVEFYGEAGTLNVTTSATTFEAKSGAEITLLKIDGGNALIEGAVSKIEITSGNTTNTTVTTASTSAPEITNNATGTMIVVTEKSEPTIVATTVGTYVSNETTSTIAVSDTQSSATDVSVSATDVSVGKDALIIAGVATKEVDNTAEDEDREWGIDDVAGATFVPLGYTLTVEAEETFPSTITANYGAVVVCDEESLRTALFGVGGLVKVKDDITITSALTSSNDMPFKDFTLTSFFDDSRAKITSNATEIMICKQDEFNINITNIDFVGYGKGSTSSQGLIFREGGEYSGLDRYNYVLETITKRNLTMENCSISNVYKTFLYISASTATIDNCVVDVWLEDVNTSRAPNGIQVCELANVAITNTQIYDSVSANTTSWSGTGVTVLSGGVVTEFSGNTLVNNDTGIDLSNYYDGNAILSSDPTAVNYVYAEENLCRVICDSYESIISDNNGDEYPFVVNIGYLPDDMTVIPENFSIRVHSYQYDTDVMQYVLDRDLTISENASLIIRNSSSFTISENVTVTNNGTINIYETSNLVNNGVIISNNIFYNRNSFINNGAFSINQGGFITNYSSVENNGSIITDIYSRWWTTSAGVVKNYGEITFGNYVGACAGKENSWWGGTESNWAGWLYKNEGTLENYAGTITFSSGYLNDADMYYNDID